MNYRKAFFATAVLVIVLVGALAYYMRQPRAMPSQSTSGTVAQTETPATSTPAAMQQTENATLKLSPVQLSPERLQSIGVKFIEVKRQAAEDEIRVTGNIDVNEERLAYVQTRFPGWIQKVFANATYQYVHKGQPLFTIYSQELVSTEQEFLLAVKNQQTLSQGHGIAANEADWLVKAARERLRQWNVPDKEIERLQKTGEVQREIAVQSPTSGYITERNALPNQFVQPETKLYTVADLSQVWAYAQVFQTDVGRLKAGDPASVTVDAYPGRTFRGRIQQILPQVDAATRTVRVRLVFENPGLLLKPGMYVNVVLDVPLGIQLLIPASGVLQSGARQIAFVDHGNGYLEPRQIETGLHIGDNFVLLKGLKAGERIVASANFLIDSEAQLQAAIGQFAPPPPGAGGAGGTAAVPMAQPANLDFTTEPSPPHKGRNEFRVNLTNASGKPITGAQVTVTFYMPAMPAMGMAAMKATATLTDKGNGMYVGTSELGSGGTWQVTVTAQQNGQALGSRQMNINVMGGM
jgi:RND family efflux transporter MFP subunit